MKKYIPSLGEQFIAEYLGQKGIVFEEQKKLENLKGDTASYRVADFYLPQYKVYIEFQGKWDNARNKRKYMKKKEVYDNNNIPCVYIYPDNLGIFGFIFKKRLLIVLHEHKMIWQLIRYWFYERFLDDFKWHVAAVGGIIYWVKTHDLNNTDKWLLLGLAGLIAFSVLSTLKEIIVKPKTR